MEAAHFGETLDPTIEHYSKPLIIRLQLIRIEIWKMLCIVEYIFRQADESRDSFFKTALLHSKTSTGSESSVDE
jgi:hypothetical protein